MKKLLSLILILAAGSLFLSCNKSSEDEYFSDYFMVNGNKFGVSSAKYKSGEGLAVTLYSGSLSLKVFVSEPLVGKTVDLAALGRSETDYWIITLNGETADSRELIGITDESGKIIKTIPRTDTGTIKLTLDEGKKYVTVAMGCELGIQTAIKAEYSGVAEPDIQDIIIDN